jgi:hypothetical protein
MKRLWCGKWIITLALIIICQLMIVWLFEECEWGCSSEVDHVWDVALATFIMNMIYIL